ncbi:MAG: hypothetical protein ACQEWV_29970 [Bacillota bacterium]
MYQGVLDETEKLFVSNYGFSKEVHQQYRKKIDKHSSNPALPDLVPRVGCGTIRKLGSNVRLVLPE